MATEQYTQGRPLSKRRAAIRSSSSTRWTILPPRFSDQPVERSAELLLSAVNPDAGFHAGTAMMRNRYIYTQSQATVVVKSDYNKGGTWSGAVECMKHHWAPVLCRSLPKAPGNRALIKQGAIPVDESWDGDVHKLVSSWNDSQPEQLSMFS